MRDLLGAASDAVKDALRARNGLDAGGELAACERAIEHLSDHCRLLRAVDDARLSRDNRQPRRAVR